MKSYLIEPLTACADPDISACVLAADYHSPFDYLGFIGEELSRENIKGSVLFDMLLANGSKRNRYYLAYFNGASFTSLQEKAPDYYYEKFSSISANILKNHIAEIDDTLLTRAMKFAVRRGIPL